MRRKLARADSASHRSIFRNTGLDRIDGTKLNNLFDTVTNCLTSGPLGNLLIKGAKGTTGKDPRLGQLVEVTSLRNELGEFKAVFEKYIAFHAANNTADDKPIKMSKNVKELNAVIEKQQKLIEDLDDKVGKLVEAEKARLTSEQKPEFNGKVQKVVDITSKEKAWKYDDSALRADLQRMDDRIKDVVRLQVESAIKVSTIEGVVKVFKSRQVQEVASKDDKKADNMKKMQIKCRICSGDHFTTKCYSKEMMAPKGEAAGALANIDDVTGGDAGGGATGTKGQYVLDPAVRALEKDKMQKSTQRTSDDSTGTSTRTSLQDSRDLTGASKANLPPGIRPPYVYYSSAANPGMPINQTSLGGLRASIKGMLTNFPPMFATFDSTGYYVNTSQHFLDGGRMKGNYIYSHSVTKVWLTDHEYLNSSLWESNAWKCYDSLQVLFDTAKIGAPTLTMSPVPELCWS
ncbi:translation initiation factor eIF3 subunit g [Elasticomyces elasticus]|nr:translation initiation factor eIF3 subunit g [Elasticomyces elasticus]